MEHNRIFKWNSSLLSTAYFPPVEYFVVLANSKTSNIEACEIFQKQSYRSRCYIYSANGPHALNIPVRRGGADFTHKLPIKEIEIDYDETWIPLHERALEAAYMNSPFFQFYKDDIFKILDSKEKFLFDLNMKLTELLLQMAGIKADIRPTTNYSKITPATVSATEYNLSGCGEIADFRAVIHPKSKQPSLLKQLQMEKPYWQVFSSKQGFIPNLSVLDLLFNEGPNAITYLLKD